MAAAIATIVGAAGSLVEHQKALVCHTCAMWEAGERGQAWDCQVPGWGHPARALVTPKQAC